MLLVVIAGLVSYIVADRWIRQRELQRLAAERDLAIEAAARFREAVPRHQAE
jgi:hypothetical protein